MIGRDVSVYLHDILESIADIETYLENVDQETFQSDRKTQDSIVRRLEVIGEAVRSIPDDFRSRYSAVPWREIAGMRDVLIHEYFGVNIDRVWESVQVDLPDLKKREAEILREI